MLAFFFLGFETWEVGRVGENLSREGLSGMSIHSESAILNIQKEPAGVAVLLRLN